MHIINIPSECPDAVSVPLQESFKLFFASPGAALNNIRISIEELLTELGVKRFNTKNGKRHYIALHQRIGLLPSKFAIHKELFLAIKWLGNAGSHGNRTASMDDVMDAYELIEHILNEIYFPKAKKLGALAKKVNKRKGTKK